MFRVEEIFFNYVIILPELEPRRRRQTVERQEKLRSGELINPFL